MAKSVHTHTLVDTAHNTTLTQYLTVFPTVGALKLTLTTNSPQEQEGDVVLYPNQVPANFTCTVVDGDGGDENYLVAWYKNNAPITPSSSSVSSASLHFEKIELSDGGWYTCATLLGNQRQRLDFLLVVGGEATEL